MKAADIMTQPVISGTRDNDCRGGAADAAAPQLDGDHPHDRRGLLAPSVRIFWHHLAHCRTPVVKPATTAPLPLKRCGELSHH